MKVSNLAGIIIAGFAGIGKTTLATKYSNVIDIESSKYKWLGVLHTTEESKGLADRVLNPNFPDNYMSAILEARNKYDFVLISCGPEVLSYLNNNKIDHKIVYPSADSKADYLKRYKDRGNLPSFIGSLDENFLFRVSNFSTNSRAFKLQGNEYLEDYMLSCGYKLMSLY